VVGGGLMEGGGGNGGGGGTKESCKRQGIDCHTPRGLTQPATFRDEEGGGGREGGKERQKAVGTNVGVMRDPSPKETPAVAGVRWGHQERGNQWREKG